MFPADKAMGIGFAPGRLQEVRAEEALLDGLPFVSTVSGP